jgi:anti-sigma factor RsiW
MMLSCDKIRQKLDPYLNGTLDHDETERIQKHLASCEGCRLMFEEERHWIHELSTLPLIPCPERVTEAILADVESRKQSMVLPGRRKRLFGRFLWKPALVFGFLIILAFAWKGDFPRK